MKNKNLALIAVLFTISVIMAFANGPTPQVVIDTDQIIDGAVDIIKTTGIADTSLSNVVPATGRAALELGTMAVATATDYIATDTFTGHTGATATHGVSGAIVGTTDTQTLTNKSISGEQICRDSELTTHGNLTAAHGATGAVMGTTNTQTVTNKTMGSGCSWGGTAVPVANGGTGATTAAAGLAALGGASLNGSSTVDFSVNHVKTATGTAAAPAYTFSSDPDTGIYSPGANSIGFSVGGADNARISANGNVLIATSTDDGANKLQVNGFTKLGEAATGIKMKVLTGTTAAAEGGTTSIAHGVSDSNDIVGCSVIVFLASGAAYSSDYDAAGRQYSWVFGASDFLVKLHDTNSENLLNCAFTAMIWYKE